MNGSLSTSNIVAHYKTKHREIYGDLIGLNKENEAEATLRQRIERERVRLARRNPRSGIERFFTSSGSTRAIEASNGTVDPKTVQAVAVVMFACVMEISGSQESSPVLQGFVEVFGGRLQFGSKDIVDRTLFDAYAVICLILRASVTHAKTGCITVDGWSSALGRPILGMTWHYIDDEWNIRCVPVATLNMGGAAKAGQQLRCIMQDILQENPIVGSDNISVHTGTSDNEAATSLAVDLLTNFVGSVRCVVHTLALAVNDVFDGGTVWKKYVDHVNKVTTYFNHHQKAAQLLAQRQLDDGIKRDRLHRLKHDFPTRWHSRLAAMSVYLTRLQNISAVEEELHIASEELPMLSGEQQDTLAEFITVLTDVRRVARQLEADRKVTMSRAPRLLRELHKTLLITAGDMLPAHGTHSTMDDGGQHSSDLSDDDNEILEVYATLAHPSNAIADKQRDELRSVRLRKNHAKALAVRLADRIRFAWKVCGDVWMLLQSTGHLAERITANQIAICTNIDESFFFILPAYWT